MRLNKENALVKKEGFWEVPFSAIYEYPEKVLQFGTGVLLRGLPDYFIDKANREGQFKGRILVVKSTDSKGADDFDLQEGIYTHCIRGIQDGVKVEQDIINSSISRVLSAKSQWNLILEAASNPELAIVISNTTEVGITLVEDDVHAAPPISFPCKLLAFLLKRYQAFSGDPSKGMVIVPTELLPENGSKLRDIVLEQARRNGLNADFTQWLSNNNHFCNSLVDRIVPGKLTVKDQEEMQQRAGYEDNLNIMSEVYRLWAIEVKDESVKNLLSFSVADAGVVLAPDIEVFRELKLRLLNGSHTFTCAYAHLLGFRTVKEAMSNSGFEAFIRQLVFDEIAPAIVQSNLSLEQAKDFGSKVLDRYRNPFIEHLWMSISLQYTSKMKMRNVPTLLKVKGPIPKHMCIGFAAYLRFMKCTQAANGTFEGSYNSAIYTITDDSASYFAEAWKNLDLVNMVGSILSDIKLWGADLSVLEGFEAEIVWQLNNGFNS
jgi:tagaturonate reductase